MKKAIFASAAALCAVVGLSSYKADTRVNVRYFTVTANLAATPKPTLSDTQVDFLSDVNPGDACSGASKLCIVSIETTYLTANKEHIAAPGTPIKTVISTKN